MPDFRHGVSPRLATGICCAFLLLLLPALLPDPCRAADITLSSRTYLLSYQRDIPGGDDQNFAPLYEYLSGDARNLGGTPLSFHFYGWGRIDLADDTDEDGRGGDLASAYLQYYHPTGNAEMRLGRFFFTEGTAAEIMDGIFLKMRTPVGFGLSVFGGIPVERTIISTETGDSIYGGRLFFVRGFAEIGVSYLKEGGDFQGDDRETVGGDLWVRPGSWVELSGRAAYNVSTSALAQQRYVLRLSPISRLDLAVGYEEYNYADLFQTALHPAFLSPTVDPTDKAQIVFAIVDIEVASGLKFEGGVKNIRHDASDPGNAIRGEGGLRYAFNDLKDVAGLSAAVVSADLKENEYQEYRAFATYSPGGWRFSLDGLTHRYKEERNGLKDAYQVVGSAGYQVLPYLKVSGDVTYTRSPRFTEDVIGLVRVSLDLAATTGAGDGRSAGETKTEAPPPAPVAPPKPPEAKPTVPVAPPKPPEAKLAIPVVPPKPPVAKPAVPVVPPKPPEAKPGVVGAPPGTAAIGPVAAYLDRMAAEIRMRLFPISVVKRQGEELDFTLFSDLVFDLGSEEIKMSARNSIKAVAGILKQYPDTLVTIEGHTDSSGSEVFNQGLSERRAKRVADLLVQNGVHARRLTVRGYGERVPVADNLTAEGRGANRRVQFKIRPDNNLKTRQGQGG